jgi:cyclophilin family peptidyl-prolyl cis-trans isomerase
VLGESGPNYLNEVENQREVWKVEAQLREAEAEADDLPRVRLTTSAGEIVIELFENEAPGAVGNFISLVEQGFYDGLVFHRVLPAFMAQGGCPEGTGTGGPGYNIYCECHEDNHRKHFAGTLSMAHAGKDTGGSQFFLTFVPTPFLNGRHTAFGRVITGMDVLPEIQRIDPDDKEAKPKPDKIIKAEVIRKRDHEYKPNKAE